jgi:phage/plasmid-like protein (TIGR03299 family)
MGHEITATDGMFSVRQMPWHGLGTVLSEYPTRDEAQRIAHDWEPVAAPLFRQVPYITEAGEPEVRYEEVDNHVLQERSDNGAQLGVTSKTFSTVSNSDMWDVAEALQGGDSSVLYETGGSLAGGKRVWLMLRLNEPIEIKGDPNGLVLPFYTLQNAHDGSASFRGQATSVRVVCANTSKMADMDARARGTEFAFSHTKNVGDRVEEARKALAGWRESIEEWQLFAEHLLSLPVSPEGQIEFAERFIPAPSTAITSERVQRNIEASRGQFMQVLRGVTCEGIDATAYGLFQAASEYSEHVRYAQTEETRFKRAVLDKNSVLTTAVKLAQEAALV